MQIRREELMDEVISLSYFMRGALPYVDAYSTSHIERSRIRAFLDERISTELQKTYPNY